MVNQTTSSNTVVIGGANSPVQIPLPKIGPIPLGVDIGFDLVQGSDWILFTDLNNITSNPSTWLPQFNCPGFNVTWGPINC